MQIILSNAGKRFNREWIFRHINFEFSSSRSYAITGPNGSGKSTLLQILAGALHQSEGKISYFEHAESKEKEIPGETIFGRISFVAPYLELIEEMTARELLRFHAAFKSFVADGNTILNETGLYSAADKQIRYFSSGMKQRLKLGIGFFGNSEMIFLDEPTTNLDAEGIQLYHSLVDKFTKQKLLVVSSNDRVEYGFCDQTIDISMFKTPAGSSPDQIHKKRLPIR
jgi:ABC-type multidrug transport system ATPase subunit